MSQPGRSGKEIPESNIGVKDGSATEDDAASEASTTEDLLSAVEDSLPTRRGLSSHYVGKAKSFWNLADMSVEDSKYLSKKEHPVNKRRRLLIALERVEGMKGADDDQKNEGDIQN